MNAEQILSLADVLRSHALDSGQDLNASNSFVHRMLMQAMNTDGEAPNVDHEEYDA